MEATFEGRSAIVTGTSSGIGKAVALRLARQGAAVCGAADRNVKGGQATAREIADAGGRSIFVQADVSREADCRRLVDEAVAALGGVDVLVNNAGVFRTAPLEEMAEQFWDAVLAINLKSAYMLSRLVVGPMIARGGGGVVNISSIHALSTQGGCAAYAASKAGMCGLTRALACEFGPRGVRFNCILPGTIDLSIYPHGDGPADRQAWRPRANDMQVLKRQGTPEEVAAAVCFVASDAAAFVNGASLVVDGGLVNLLRDF